MTTEAFRGLAIKRTANIRSQTMHIPKQSSLIV